MPRLHSRIAAASLPVAALAALALLTGTVRAADDVKARGPMVELVLLRDQARRACAGNDDAYADLQERARRLAAAFAGAGAVAEQRLWRDIDAAVAAMLARRSSVRDARTLGARIAAETAPSEARADELVGILVGRDESAATIQAAYRVLLILQRRKTQVADVMGGTDSGVVAADALERDEKLLRTLLATLAEGKGIKANQDPNAGALLRDLATAVSEHAGDIERLRAAAPDFSAACEQADALQEPALQLLQLLQHRQRG